MTASYLSRMEDFLAKEASLIKKNSSHCIIEDANYKS